MVIKYAQLVAMATHYAALELVIVEVKLVIVEVKMQHVSMASEIALVMLIVVMGMQHVAMATHNTP